MGGGLQGWGVAFTFVFLTYCYSRLFEHRQERLGLDGNDSEYRRWVSMRLPWGLIPGSAHCPPQHTHQRSRDPWRLHACCVSGSRGPGTESHGQSFHFLSLSTPNLDEEQI